MSTAVGIVALSFAKRAVEPNPVNTKLARVTDGLREILESRGGHVVTVAQVEIASAMKLPPELIVTKTDATKIDHHGRLYLDSEDVLNRAFHIFEKEGITRVIVVANRFLHKQLVETMVRRAGYEVVEYAGGVLGFDNSPLNLQWWCKGPIRFVTYLGLQVVGKLTGKNFHGIGEKSPL